MKTMLKAITALAMSAITAMPATPLYAASQLESPIDPAVIVQAGGFEWVWAAPCAPIEQSCGVVVFRDNFRLATEAEWHVSFASNDALATAFIKNGDALCAAAWFSSVHDHCDKQDLLDGFVWGAPAPIGNSRNYDPAAEAFLVRAVPEPEGYAMLLAGLGMVGYLARRKRTG